MHLHLPPTFASILTVGFIIFLFRRDIREKPDVSGGLWLPLIWFVITCSSGIVGWLNIFGLHVPGASSLEEGSPVDAAFFLALIVVGICVLSRRNVGLSEVLQNNGWLFAFLLYCGISILWSDFPFVAFKRWFKILGHPIMALIILTEPNRVEAVARLMKRCAYVVIPVSILFIKYYSQLGRYYDKWSGVMMFKGIAADKNMLGADCLILGFFFFWHWLQTWRTERSTRRRHELWLIAGFLIGIVWLLRQAHSATSITTLFIGAAMVVLVGTRFINKNLIGTYMLIGLVLIVIAELEFDISARYSEALGKGSTLSGRTELWGRLLQLGSNPVIGTGFESFWLGGRLQRMAEIYWWHPNEAHNGYLEIYLSLGLVGVFILVGIYIATFWKIRGELFRNFEWGRYRLGFFAAVVLYNCTEAAFKTLHPIWFAFYIIAIEYRGVYFITEQPLIEAEAPEASREIDYTERES
jgi:exopolysaccharide production protein ExoQ